MTWWQGIVLGLVQGLTEFLPVSSSGHLVLAEALVGFEKQGVFVEVALHVATLLAVFIVYRQKLLSLLTGTLRGDRAALTYVWLLVVATIPAGVIGVLFKDFFERSFNSLFWVGIEFIANGAILWSVKGLASRASRTVPTNGSALAIGVGQAFGILPAISRSGSTVVTALWTGLKPAEAAEFSFLMAIPTILGAAVLEARHGLAEAAAVGTGPLALSFVVALVSGVASIVYFIRTLQRGQFHWFGAYCAVLGVATTIWALAR